LKQYLEALDLILENGDDVINRTGIDTRKLFGLQFRYDMKDGFPAVTTKRLAWEMVKGELLWFLKGTGDVNELKKIMKKDFTIWNANAEADYWKPKARFDGDLGRVYGVQWRSWISPPSEDHVEPINTIDQIATVIENIKRTKEDNSVSEARRLIVTAWNSGELHLMALPPCHYAFQFNVSGEYLDLMMIQRSVDSFIGEPFNIASYALLLHMVAQVTGLKPGAFIHSKGDCHIYHNHFDQVKEQLTREPLPLPELWLNPDIKNIDDFKMEDIELVGYQNHGIIKGEMAV